MKQGFKDKSMEKLKSQLVVSLHSYLRLDQ